MNHETIARYGKQMFPGFVLIGFILIVIYTYISWKHNTERYSATASAIRQIWSGTCRVSCQDKSRPYNFTQYVVGNQGAATSNRSNQCLCESCPCALIENVLRRCTPAASLYNTIVAYFSAFCYSLVETITRVFTYVNSVRLCYPCHNALAERQRLIESESTVQSVTAASRTPISQLSENVSPVESAHKPDKVATFKKPDIHEKLDKPDIPSKSETLERAGRSERVSTFDGADKKSLNKLKDKIDSNNLEKVQNFDSPDKKSVLSDLEKTSLDKKSDLGKPADQGKPTTSGKLSGPDKPTSLQKVEKTQDKNEFTEYSYESSIADSESGPSLKTDSPQRLIKPHEIASKNLRPPDKLVKPDYEYSQRYQPHERHEVPEATKKSETIEKTQKPLRISEIEDKAKDVSSTKKPEKPVKVALKETPLPDVGGTPGTSKQVKPTGPEKNKEDKKAAKSFCEMCATKGEHCMEKCPYAKK